MNKRKATVQTNEKRKRQETGQKKKLNYLQE